MLPGIICTSSQGRFSWRSVYGIPIHRRSVRSGSISLEILAHGRRRPEIRNLQIRSDYQGIVLKRPPKGFETDHELIEELKWKDYIAARDVSESFLTDATLPQELARLFKIGTPLMKFLCSALAVPF